MTMGVKGREGGVGGRRGMGLFSYTFTVRVRHTR